MSAVISFVNKIFLAVLDDVKLCWRIIESKTKPKTLGTNIQQLHSNTASFKCLMPLTEAVIKAGLLKQIQNDFIWGSSKKTGITVNEHNLLDIAVYHYPG